LFDGPATAPLAPLRLVILDNAHIHHGLQPEIVDRWRVDHRLVLWHLPPYSHELNTIENIWREARYRWRRFVTWSCQELETEVRNLLEGRGAKYQGSFA
jgi:transposase